MAQLKAALTLNSNVYGGKKTSYVSSYSVNSAFDTTFKVNNADALNQLVSFKTNGLETYNKFNFLVLANEGGQPAEIQILLQEFGVDDDIVDDNPNSATIDFILHPGRYITIPTSKMFIYGMSSTDDLAATADTSAGNMNGTSPYNDAYDGAAQSPTFIDPPGYFSASGADGTVVITTSGSPNYIEVDVAENFFLSQQFGDSTNGYSNAKICLFGECDAAQLGTVYTIADLLSGTAYNSSKLEISSLHGSTIADADGTQIGGYKPIALLNEALDASETSITWDNFGSDATVINLFKKYDIIRVGNELMQVISNTSVTVIEVERGVLGTTAAVHDNNDGIGFHYMSEALSDVKGVAGIVPLKGISNIYTSAKGSFSSNTFFGLGRDVALPNGLVPGSIALKFYSPARLSLGMTGVSDNISTGLAVNTAYKFNITFDGNAEQPITFTTDAANVSFGNHLNGTGVLKKIQNALDDNSVINGNVRVITSGRDIQFVTETRYNGLSSISLAAADSGNQLFGSGKFPAVTTFRPLRSPMVPSDDDLTNIMFDDGLGHLRRKAGGSGIINYETGAFKLFGCPINSHMKIACNFNSALSGSIKSGRGNYFPVVKARSLNAFRDAYVRVLAYDDIIDDDNVEILMGGTETDGTQFKQDTNPNSGRY